MSKCKSCCSTPFGICGNRNCRCHPIESRPVLDDLRKQASLRREADRAGEQATYIDAFDHADRRRRA